MLHSKFGEEAEEEEEPVAVLLILEHMALLAAAAAAADIQVQLFLLRQVIHILIQLVERVLQAQVEVMQPLVLEVLHQLQAQDLRHFKLLEAQEVNVHLLTMEMLLLELEEQVLEEL